MVFSIVSAYGILAVGRVVAAWRWSRFPEAGGALVVLFTAGTASAAALGLLSFLSTYQGSYKESAAGYSGWQWGARATVERFVAEEKNYDEVVLDGYAFNAPQIFLRFYAPNGCERCVVRYDNPDEYLKKQQLFAFRPETRLLEYQYAEKGTLYNPSGGIAIAFVEIVGPKPQPTTPPPTNAPANGRCEPTQSPNQWLCVSTSFSPSFTRVDISVVGGPDSGQKLIGVTFTCTSGPGSRAAGVFEGQTRNNSIDFPSAEHWSADYLSGCQMNVAVGLQPTDAVNPLLIQKVIFR